MKEKQIYTYPWNAIEKPMNLLIQCGLDAQDHEKFKFCLEKNNIASLVNEFCTLHIRGPRCAGHGKAIFKAIKKFKFNRVAYVVYNEDQEFAMRNHPDAKNVLDKIFFVTAFNFTTLLRGQSDFDAMFVDVACMFSSSRKEHLANIASIFAQHKIEQGKKFLLVYVQ